MDGSLLFVLLVKRELKIDAAVAVVDDVQLLLLPCMHPQAVA